MAEPEPAESPTADESTNLRGMVVVHRIAGVTLSPTADESTNLRGLLKLLGRSDA